MVERGHCRCWYVGGGYALRADSRAMLSSRGRAAVGIHADADERFSRLVLLVVPRACDHVLDTSKTKAVCYLNAVRHH
jgi:hypothetical protein